MDAKGCVVSRVGSESMAILWPERYRARTTDGILEVLNASGAVVARSGSVVALGGGVDVPGPRVSGRCIDGYSQVWIAQSDPEPLS